MKFISLKNTLLIAGISILSGCYTQLSQPVVRQEYYAEQDTPDTSYYSEDDYSDYNFGYRDGYRDFLNDYLWYGYNPNSQFNLYYSHRSYWNQPWGYRHSAFLGYYDPYFYDPFWDWGYYGYYSPYSYYGYSGWYYYPYSGYRYYSRYHRGGFTGAKKVSEARQQLSATRSASGGSASAGRATRVSNTPDNNLEATMNMPMATRTKLSGGSSDGNQTSALQLPDGIVKTRTSDDFQTLDVRNKKSPDEPIPGFQSTLIAPVRPETIPMRATGKVSGRSSSAPANKKLSPSRKTRSSRSSSSARSSSSSSGSSYRAPSKSSSSSSSTGGSSSVRSSSSGSRSSSSRSSGRSSSRSGSSRSSSSSSSSSKKSSKNKR